MGSDIEIRPYRATTLDGWSLELRRTRSPSRLDRSSLPLLMLPGYGMNNFILGYHPRGTSMESCLAEAGFEVWSVNMRGQGRSRPLSQGAPPPSIQAYVNTDVPAAVEVVQRETSTGSDRCVLVGCSLGGTIAYAHVATRAEHSVAALIAVGGPLRWNVLHPAVRLTFASPWLASKIHMRGTRRLAGIAFPIAARLPKLLGIYMNPKHVDVSAMPEMVNTVDDLHPRVNRDIARWIRARDLVLDGTNVTGAVADVSIPLLIVVANRDGIVPPGAALSARDLWGGRDVEVLHVGDEQQWFSHADLFISNDAPRRVFEPMATWLRARAAGGGGNGGG